MIVSKDKFSDKFLRFRTLLFALSESPVRFLTGKKLLFRSSTLSESLDQSCSSTVRVSCSVNCPEPHVQIQHCQNLICRCSTVRISCLDFLSLIHRTRLIYHVDNIAVQNLVFTSVRTSGKTWKIVWYYKLFEFCFCARLKKIANKLWYIPGHRIKLFPTLEVIRRRLRRSEKTS
jgi:hypothetical protein